jgi:hypothetical protein
MTTFLLSQKINTLFGILISLYVCIYSTFGSSHITSPAYQEWSTKDYSSPRARERPTTLFNGVVVVVSLPTIFSEISLLYLFKV